MDATSLQLQRMRDYYNSGATRSYQYRREQLLKLKDALKLFENELHDALYQDLRKNPEEAWVTETGFVHAEINHVLRHLKSWMKPEHVPTNFLNFPSESSIYKEPLGVVLIIGPWNYPIQLLVNPLVGAIAAGNCIVLKPSEFAPATASALRTVIEKTFPPEYILYVEGDGATVVPSMIQAFHFDHIFFTGSTRTGKLIYAQAAQSLTPVTLELGGKSPCVVEKDAVIKVAARRIAVTKFSNAGQMCVAPDYLLVHRSIKDEFIETLKRTIIDFYTAEPFTSYNYGRLINETYYKRVKELLSQGTIIFGGRVDDEKLLIEPTLLENIHEGASIMEEEIFAPVLPVYTFETFEEAKAIIDRHRNPLAFYVFTQSKALEQKWLQAVSFGGGCVNNASWHLTNYNLPFGGRGNSGIGRYHGKFSFEVFSHQKAVMKTPTWFDPAIKYPPFKGKLKWFKKLIR